MPDSQGCRRKRSRWQVVGQSAILEVKLASPPEQGIGSMDVEAWLQGLERYIAAFRNNEIDWEVLPRLTSEDLREIGVAAIRHRRKLLDAIAALGAAPSPDWRSGQADELVGGDNSVCCDSPRRRGEKRPTPVNRGTLSEQDGIP